MIIIKRGGWYSLKILGLKLDVFKEELGRMIYN